MLEFVKSIRDGLGSAVATVVILGMALFAVIGLSLRWELITVDFFVLLFAVAVLLAGVWLRHQGRKGLAGLFAFGATIAIVTVCVKHNAPGLFHLGKAGSQKADISADRSADLLETPHAVPCLAPFFVGHEGKSRYWRAPSEYPVLCYDRPGVHPETREALIAVDESAVSIIKREHDEADRKIREAAEAQAKARGRDLRAPEQAGKLVGPAAADLPLRAQTLSVYLEDGSRIILQAAHDLEVNGSRDAVSLKKAYHLLKLIQLQLYAHFSARARGGAALF